MGRFFTLRTLVLSAVTMLAASLAAQVAGRPSREALDSLLNPTLHPDASAILLFEKVREDIGTIYESDSVRTLRFVFRNVSGAPVRLTKVTTHCGCTVSSFSRASVAAGDTSEVVVKYNPRRRSGTIDTDAFVYTDRTGNMPAAKLTVTGNVVNTDEWNHLPHSMGALRVKRTKVSIGKGRTEARIPCANVGKTPLRPVQEVSARYATFSVEPSVLQPGEEGDIVITIDRDALGTAAAGERHFSVVVGGVEGRISSRTIKVTIE